MFAVKLAEKRQQHAGLMKHLRDQGWKVYNDAVTVLLFGHEGMIFHPCCQALTDLGVLCWDAVKTMNGIHVQVVKAAQGIVSSRRCLERGFVDGDRSARCGCSG